MAPGIFSKPHHAVFVVSLDGLIRNGDVGSSVYPVVSFVPLIVYFSPAT